MLKPSATSPSSLENGRTSTGQTPDHGLSSAAVKVIAIAQSLKRRAEDRPEVAKLDALVAPDFDKACSAYLRVKGIKADELAERMGVDEHYLSKMRKGAKPIALRHTIPLRDCREAVEQLIGPACRDVGLAIETRHRLSRGLSNMKLGNRRRSTTSRSMTCSSP